MRQIMIASIFANMIAAFGGGRSAQVQQSGRATPEDVQTIARRFKQNADALPGPVDAFDFEISLRPHHQDEYLMPWLEIELTVASTRMISSEKGTTIVEVSQINEPGLIDVAVKKARGRELDRGPEGMVPEKWFRFRLETLQFPKDHPIYLRLRFRNADEYFALTFDAKEGLRLVGVGNRFGKVKKGALREFAILETREGERTYECSNMSLVARSGNKELWKRRLPLAGAPKELRIVGDTLFVPTTHGHSLYVRKNDGKIIFYHKDVLPGKAPWDELQELARAAYRRESEKNVELYRYIGAAALLQDKRAAPFLIECIEKGLDLTERWWAVAALEHLNGNSKFWKDLGEGQPWDPIGETDEPDYKRISTDAAAKAEVQKWQRVFGKVKTPVLTRPKD